MVSGLGLDRSSMGSCGWGCETGSWAMMGNWHTTELIRDWGTGVHCVRLNTSNVAPVQQDQDLNLRCSVGRSVWVHSSC